MKRGSSIPLGRVLGIPIGIDYSWFLIFLLITWSLASSYYPAQFTSWPAVLYWIVGAATAILFFASVVLHELGHSVVAMHYKIPVRSITLFIFGGIAQIGSEPPSAVSEFWIAIAGPAVSFALAGLFALLQPLVGAAAPLLALAQYLAYINGALGLFNLIPGFPLDGGRVFRAIVWAVTHNLHRATAVAANVGKFVSFLFIGLGVWLFLTGDWIDGMWIAFIGWFLQNAASSQLEQQQLEDMLTGHTVAEAMTRSYTAVPADTTLQELVDDHILGTGRSLVVEQANNDIAGLLSVPRIKAIQRDRWPSTTVGQVMIPMSQLKALDPDAELWSALGEMQRDNVSQLPVIADHHVAGLLTRESIASFLHTLHELGLRQGPFGPPTNA